MSIILNFRSKMKSSPNSYPILTVHERDPLTGKYNILPRVLLLVRYAEHLRPGTNPGRRAIDGSYKISNPTQMGPFGWDLRTVSFSGF